MIHIEWKQEVEDLNKKVQKVEEKAKTNNDHIMQMLFREIQWNVREVMDQLLKSVEENRTNKKEESNSSHDVKDDNRKRSRQY